MRTQITEIPTGSYTGYYWMSDQSAPVLITSDRPFQMPTSAVPFVVEANLFDAKANRSISVRHNGSQAVMHLYDLNACSGYEAREICFIAHRLPGKGRVKFEEIWKEESDPLCAGMTTLKPFARVFTGFEND